MKRIFLLGFFLILAIVIAGGLIFRSISPSGSGAIEQWIGSQLQAIANSYLNPQLKFSQLDYTYPLTVSLKDLSLTADDPANPGQTIQIIGTESAVLTLAKIPRVNEPIAIEKIVLDRPLFAAIAVEPRSTKFVGFSNLLRHAPTTAPTTVAQAPTTRPVLSDVFKIRLIELNDGRIVYDPRIPDTEPMRLDQINTTLNVQPTGDGWYKLSTDITRDPIFDLAVAGEVNLDTFRARGMNVLLSADLAVDKRDYLPPQLQQFLEKYDVAGKLDVNLTGELPIMAPTQGNLQTEAHLTNANVTLGEYRIPVQKLLLSGTLESRTVNLRATAEALRGTMQVTNSTILNEQMDSSLKLSLSNMQLHELLATRKEGEPLKLAGRMSGAFEGSAPLKLVVEKATNPTTQPVPPMLPEKWGSGSIELVDGQLVRLPVIHSLTETVGKAAKLVSVGQLSTAPKDRVRIVLTMERSHANITQFQYVGDLIAARGTGTIGLNRTVDMKVNAGPVERVQALLGEQLGAAIGMLTDKLLAYRVTGKIGDPKVEPVIAGGAIGGIGRGARSGADAVGRGARSGAESVGRGVEKIGEGIGNILKPKETQ